MSSSSRFISSARVTSLLTLLSRMAGLGREVLFSFYFSTGELLSAFRIAFIIPNLARRLFGEGALSAAVIPVLTTTLRDRGEESSRGLVGSLLGTLILVLGVATVLAEAGALFVRYFHDDPAVRLTAITLPYMPMICAVALLSGVLNVRGHFAAPAAAPILFNLVVIAVTLVAAFGAGLTGAALMDVLCYSVLVGGLVQLALVLWALKRADFLPRWGLGLRDPQIRSVATLMTPMFLGLSAVQINTFLDQIIAYVFIIVDGERIGPAVLGYAQFLYQFPLGVFGVGLATAIFPLLAAKAAEGDHAGLANAVQRGLRLSLFIALPASVGMIFVARPLVAVLYQRGAFTAEDTHRVAATLAFYSLGLAAYFAQHVVIRTFYALHDSKTPARIALYVVGMNLLLNLVLVFPLQWRGLALSTATTATIQVLWLGAKLRHRIPQLDWRPVVASFGRVGVACGIMSVLLALLTWPPIGASWMTAHDGLHLLTLVVIGTATYAFAAHWLRIEELRWALNRPTNPRPLADCH